MPPPPATPAPRAASCFAKEAVRQGGPEPPPPPFQPHPSLRLRQTKGGVLRSHQPSRTQEFLIGGKPLPPKPLSEMAGNPLRTRICCKVGGGLRKRRGRVQIRPRSRTDW